MSVNVAIKFKRAAASAIDYIIPSDDPRSERARCVASSIYLATPIME